VSGARGVLVNITGGEDLSLTEVNDATSIIYEAAGEEANLFFGAVIDPAVKGKILVTVIATGIGDSAVAERVEEREPVPAVAGETVAFKTPEIARKGDKIWLVTGEPACEEG